MYNDLKGHEDEQLLKKRTKLFKIIIKIWDQG